MEFCQRTAQERRAGSSPGIVLYDVTEPLAPRRLAPDFSLGFEAHNAFLYQQGERAFVLVVQDESPRDFHIVEITDPSSPVTVSVRGWRDWLDPEAQMALGALPAAFLHDMWAQSYPADHPNRSYAGKTIAYLAYWDAGLIILDITDPANPIFLGDSDYLSPDPLTGKPPEGNSHSTVPTEDGSLVFMGDEDFSAAHLDLTIESGSFPGEFRALEATFTPRLNDMPEQTVTGQAVFIGSACAPESIPPPGATRNGKLVALIERGDCTFADKIGNAAAAGYDAAIVFGNVEAPDQLVPMSGAREKGKIPAFFVRRSVAFALLGLSPESPKETPLPEPGTIGERVTIRATFDGWGYGRVLDVRDPAKIVEVGRYATKEALLSPPPPGDHSMHNVIIEGRRAYISWYADGIRVVDFTDPANPREVARFVDNARGSDFWGVYLYRHPDGNTYILGSDRSTGLWVFEKP